MPEAADGLRQGASSSLRKRSANNDESWVEMKKVLGIVAVNIVIAGFLIFLLNTLSIVVIQAFNWQKPKQYAQSHLFPNYAADSEAAKVHFTEYDNLTKGHYEAFYGWRRPAIQSQTINIGEDGLRRTYQPEGAAPSKTIAFFGGSTTWGTGADDLTTIPSYVAKKVPDFRAINFGETGYVAHQSLNLFLRHHYEGFRPDVVVSYDGVNDVWNKCRREMTSYSHSREHEIRLILKEGSPANPETLMFTIQPMRNFAEKAARTLQSRQNKLTSYYECDENPDKAEQVARVLLWDWRVMKTLVEAYGGDFIPILQPHAYISETKLDHLDLDETLGRQYAAVYPKVIELLDKEFADLKPDFVDLRTALDTDDYVYIDWCHLSPNGNEMIAARISDVLAERGSQTTAWR